MTFSTTLIQNYIINENGLVVHDPATQDVLATVKNICLSEAKSIIKQAEIAQKNWAAQTAKVRGTLLRNWHDSIIENQETLAQMITAESGKPLAESRGEVAYGASFVEWFAEEGKRAYGDVIPHHAADKRIITLKQPIGVTAAITPWNFPLAMITRKVAPALAAGCAMIVKPAEATPLTALALEHLAHRAGIPVDLYRTVTTTKPAAMGKLFCEDPTIRKLSFTGSTSVGKHLMTQCAGTVKRISMELGGNAPFIVFDDADLDAAIEGALVCKYRNAGQTCVCANRFLVQSEIYDQFVEKLTARVSDFNVGNGTSEDTKIGPLINNAGKHKVNMLVDDAIKKGAIATIGGKTSTQGTYFYEPTVLSNVTEDMDIVNTEIFGPVAPIIRFDTEEEAITLANDTPFGLAAYFYSRDIARIWRVMEALEYGMVAVNDGILSTETAPFGGIKESGIGREGSKLGLDEYLEVKYTLLGGL